MESNTIIKLENFSMERDGNVLLENANLEIKRGEIVFFLGDNGCGKSTMLSLFRKTRDIGKAKKRGRISKLDKISDKAVFGGIFGLTCAEDEYNLVNCDFGKGHSSNFYYENIAYLDQSDLAESFARVKRTLSFPTEVALYELFKAKKLSKEQFAEKKRQLKDEVASCLQVLEKSSSMSLKRAGKLSGGQKRLVSFFRTYIRAKVLGAQVLVLDEPLNHLDCKYKKTINEMLALFIDERSRAGNPVTVIIVSHCLPFTFIEYENCKQIQFVKKGLEIRDKKLFYTCLSDAND